MAIVANKVVNILLVLGGQPEVFPKDFEKDIGGPSSVINLIEEITKQEVGDLSRICNEGTGEKKDYCI